MTAPPPSLSRQIWVYDRSQLVHVTLGVAPDSIVRSPETIVEAFNNVTGGRVVIDDVRYHVTEENIVKRTWYVDLQQRCRRMMLFGRPGCNG